jgi:uncharacterized protein YdaT
MRQRIEDGSVDEGYRAMAADKIREKEAQDWGYALAKDMATDIQDHPFENRSLSDEDQACPS